MKTSENQRFSDVFRGYRKRPVAWNGLRPIIDITNIITDNNILTLGHDNSVSLSQFTDESEKEVSPPVTSKRIRDLFCSETVFILIKKVLNEIEIKVLKKGLGFVPTPIIINEENPSRKMRCKWYFRDEPSPDFEEILAFRPKSNSKPSHEHPCVELFLNKLESELLSFLSGNPQV